MAIEKDVFCRDYDKHRYSKRRELVDPIANAELLNSVSVEVATDEFASDETRGIIDDMMWLAAGKDAEGGAQMVGLAAPQIGESKRIAIVDINATGMREKQDMLVLINPEIIEMSEEVIDGREGCWSCGDYCANVPRSRVVTVRYCDDNGEPLEIRAEDFTARIIQHEIDHLNGIRCIDRVPIEEPWRLHRVNKDNKDEFQRYRVEWKTWVKTFPRDEWEKFRDGKTVDA